jgi:phosphoadenosine phosphosulfate reductase
MGKELNTTELRKLVGGKSIEESLKILVSLFPDKILLTTSFGIEDQVITHFVFVNNLPIEIATIDTGRLFPETYDVFNKTIKKYQRKIKVYFPDHEAVESMVTEKGPYSFYLSKENRLECCSLRKVIPLNRALTGKEMWISGIRAGQSENRGKMDWLEYDEEKKLFKYYPLFNWSFEEVKNFIKDNDVPYNVLHDKNFVSIGCEPCTRAVKPGEDFRSGRWWWETDKLKECGCHIR